MTGTKRKQPVILLIEDDPDDQALTRRALNGGDVDLRIAEDGEDGLDYLLNRGVYSDCLQNPRPDLVLLDLNLPKISGCQILAKVREEQLLHNVPIIVLTTSDQQRDISKSYELGCSSFITKPVDLEEFIQMIRDLKAYWLDLVTLPAI